MPLPDINFGVESEPALPLLGDLPLLQMSQSLGKQWSFEAALVCSVRVASDIFVSFDWQEPCSVKLLLLSIACS